MSAYLITGESSLLARCNLFWLVFFFHMLLYQHCAGRHVKLHMEMHHKHTYRCTDVTWKLLAFQHGAWRIPSNGNFW